MDYILKCYVQDEQVEIYVDDDEVIDALFDIVKDKTGKAAGLDRAAFVKAMNALKELELIDISELVDVYEDDLKDAFYWKAEEAYDDGQAWKRHCKRYFATAPLR